MLRIAEAIPTSPRKRGEAEKQSGTHADADGHDTPVPPNPQ